MKPGVLATAFFLTLLPVRAGAQDAAATVASAQKALSAYQFASALGQFMSVPDTAAPVHRLAKHTGASAALQNMGRVAEAGTHIELARPLVNQVGTDHATVQFLNAEGLYLNAARQGDRGLSSLHRAEQIAERAGAKTALTTVYTSLLIVYQGLEDYERQTYYNQKAFDLEPNPTPIDRFRLHILRGIAFFEMYERDRAEEDFTRALELSVVTTRTRDRAFALGELAYLYWTFDRDAARALPLYDEAIELTIEAKVASMEANWRTNRGNIYRDTGDYDRAEADYRDAIAILEKGGQGSSGFHIWKNRGQVRRLRGDNAGAAAFLERVMKERGHTAGLRHTWQAHMELASAYAALGERDRADRNFRAMLDVLEEHRNSAILDAFRTGRLAHQLSAYDPYERYIRFLLENQPPQVEAALAIAERARARGFLEALASVRGTVAARLPPALLAEDSRIHREISAAQEKLRAADLPKADRDRLLGELERAEQQRDAFVLKLRVEHPSLAEARYPALLDTKDLQAALRAEEIAVVFFLAEPGSFRWVLSKEHVVADRIAGRHAIERASLRLRDLLRAPSNQDEVARASAELSGMLFGGIATADDRPMVVVPHGALNYLPFDALPLQGRMLVERHAVSYAPSLNALVQLRRSPANTAPFRVLAVGNPLIAGAPAATERGDVENLALLGPLPFAEQELHAIGRTFRDRTRIMSGASARESGLRDGALPQYPVLHFATHGLVSDVQPKRSGLLLASETGEDGLLQMSEIYALGLKANLVVLSACQTALGREITGEGLIGLSRAFFFAGARSVVATLWNLNDRFAAEFVERFYNELNQGHAPEEALRRAKIAYVNHPRYSHPFYWSSLVMLGDGTAALVKEPVRQPMGLHALAAAFSLTAIAIVFAKTRHSARF
jgi:CHAT domain-containing protein/tetratricopeptide (TPR) repeat protein